MQSRIITLTTDFGLRGPYVGAMKGVILKLNPQVQIVDITHEIAPQNIREGSLCLAQASGYFPAGTIHVAVVDPGVGGSRRLLCVSMHNQWFLAPDNGLLVWPARGARSIERYELSNRQYWRSPVSATFHGRDVLAPVAAHLSLGVQADQLGRVVPDWIELAWPTPRRAGDQITGEILIADRFGNLITNISDADLAGIPIANLSCAGFDVRIGRTYSDVADGELVGLFGSYGLIEIATRNGNAAECIRAGVGDAVIVQLDIGDRTTPS
jgi:S-adenosylmethionine hydrolase